MTDLGPHCPLFGTALPLFNTNDDSGRLQFVTAIRESETAQAGRLNSSMGRRSKNRIPLGVTGGTCERTA